MTNSTLFEKMLNALLLSCVALRNNTSADDGLQFRTKVRNALRSSMGNDGITPKVTYAFGALADLQNVKKDDVSADLFHAYTLTLRWLHDRAKKVRTIFTDSARVYSESGFIFRRVLPTRKNECVGNRLLILLRQLHGAQAALLVAQGPQLVQLQKRRRLLKKRRKRQLKKRQLKKTRLSLQKTLLKRRVQRSNALICISGAVRGLVYTLNWVVQKTQIYWKGGSAVWPNTCHRLWIFACIQLLCHVWLQSPPISP